MPGRPTRSCCGTYSTVTTSESDPLIAGTPTGDPPIHVLAAQYVGRGLARGETGWITGSRVAALLRLGVISVVE